MHLPLLSPVPRRMPKRNKARKATHLDQSADVAYESFPSLPRKPPILPSLPKSFRSCRTRDQIEKLAAFKSRVQPRLDYSVVSTPPDEVLLDCSKVDLLLRERINNPEFVHELCDFPHALQIERLKIENELLKQALSYGKTRNAILSGELSNFKELARRVLLGDKHENAWDNRHEAFVRLIGGLLGLKSKDDRGYQGYEGHKITRKPLDRAYFGKRCVI